MILWFTRFAISAAFEEPDDIQAIVIRNKTAKRAALGCSFERKIFDRTIVEKARLAVNLTWAVPQVSSRESARVVRSDLMLSPTNKKNHHCMNTVCNRTSP